MKHPTPKARIPVGKLRPALRALSAFEAAARLRSFNAAANELHLTPSAVSHQILSLERQLGIELFARVGRGVSLTRLGERYFDRVQRILNGLDEATRDIISTGASEIVTVQTPPSLASKWLLPLLSNFLNSNPHVEVRVNAEAGKSGVNWDVIDLAIIYRPLEEGEVCAVRLIEEVIQPLCSPNILHANPIQRPSDLLKHTLIHTNYNAVTWRDWFGSHGTAGYEHHQRIRIDPSHVAIDAAAKEFGIALESNILAKDDLSSGRLVAPLNAYAVKRGSYILAWPSDQRLSHSARMFKDWLVAVALDDQHSDSSAPRSR